MKRLMLASMTTALLAAPVFPQTPSQDIARGNMPMHMDVKAMDTNHDGMISKDEFAAYGEKIWQVISRGSATVAVSTAAIDFATGNMAMNAQEMDTDHDGSLSHAEFIAYGSRAFDSVKNPKGMLTLSDTTKYFSTGNSKP
jgi:hypothetical protein